MGELSSIGAADMNERLDTKVVRDNGAVLLWCGEGVIGHVEKSEAIMGSTEIAQSVKLHAALRNAGIASAAADFAD